MKCTSMRRILQAKVSLQQYILYDDGMGGQQEVWDEYRGMGKISHCLERKRLSECNCRIVSPMIYS